MNDAILTHRPHTSAARAVDKPLPPIWLGPLVRARTGSHHDLLFEHPGGIKGAYAWSAGATILTIVLFTEVLDVHGFWGPALAGLLAAALARLPVRVGRWYRQRRMTRQPLSGPLADLPDGTLVRLSGVIEPERGAFPALGGGKPAVFVRTVFPLSGEVVGGPGFREDVRGIPFQIRLRDGTRVRLDPATLHPVDEPAATSVPVDLMKQLSAARPQRRSRGNFRQVRLAPGDRIEVMGCLNKVVDPQGQSAPGRGVPLAFTLSPAGEGRVMLRKRRLF